MSLNRPGGSVGCEVCGSRYAELDHTDACARCRTEFDLLVKIAKKEAAQKLAAMSVSERLEHLAGPPQPPREFTDEEKAEGERALQEFVGVVIASLKKQFAWMQPQ